MSKERAFELAKSSSFFDGLEFSIDKLRGDASTRNYYRITSEKENYILCECEKWNANEKSFPQITSFFSDKGVRVPKVYYHDGDKGFMILEDLGESHLINLLGSNQEKELDVYKQVIIDLLKIHCCQDEKEKLFTESFDENKLMSETNKTIEYFIKKWLNVTEEKKIKELESMFVKINLEISKLPQVISHRDFHSRNVMVKNNDLVVIDYQDAMLGHPTYDLCSLLHDCYYSISKENRDVLLKFYFDNAKKENLFHEDWDSFMRSYYLVATQRIFKAIGTFCYQYYEREQVGYLKYINSAFENLKDVLDCGGIDKRLKILLSELYYES